MLKDVIEVSKGFQSAVNIEYDFNDINKITGFIPTSSALEIINNILINTEPESTERAKILTGAYGRGKSHIVLIALSILYNKKVKDFQSLLEKIKRIDENTYKRIKNYILSKNRLLPIIINGNGGNLTQVFLSALQQALKQYELEDIMPETHFQAAIKTIERWEKEFPQTYLDFTELIDGSIEDFKSRLKINDSVAYKEFDSYYPQLTAGSSFNPFGAFKVADIYEQVNTALKGKGYTGMYIVYDEFGKYLESSIASASESETKMLQDLAEKCNRESGQQLHLMLICHKDISNYIDMNMPRDKVDGWRGISGRFEHINLSNNFYQMYEIIADAIVKQNTEWDKFHAQYRDIFAELKSIYSKNNFLDGKDDLVICGCYPLHPVTTYILPRLSEKIAQNERTLFTFLTANQKNTLREFVRKSTDEFSIVTPDYIYDYFEKELRKELNSSEIYKTYVLSAKILNRVESTSLSAKIIKTIALINFVQQYEKISPTIDTICDVFSVQFDRQKIVEEINKLINEKYIVYHKESNGHLCLKKSSGVDVNAEIENRVAKLKVEKSTEEALNICANNNYLYPIRHNDSNCITRYFDFKFLNHKNVVAEINRGLPTDVSGRVYAVFFDTYQEFEESKNSDLINHCHDIRTVVIFPRNFKDIMPMVYRYLAAKELYFECTAEESVLKSEYTMHIDDLEVVIFNYISDYTRPELNNATYYYLNRKQDINRKSMLTALLSRICDRIYQHTPIINNESLNKNVLSGVAINSRTKLTTALLESEKIEKNLGLTGTGQDVSFMRSTLMQTGILIEENGEYTLTLEPENNNIHLVLNTIVEFFNSTMTDGEKKFSDLYYSLVDYRNGIGMKKGVIPVFIATVLNKMKNDLVFICNGEEVKLSSDVLNSINEKPELYSVIMENWDDDKTQYLLNLSTIFEDTVIEKEKSFNGFVYIANAMNRWYMSLPKCAKEMTVYYDTQNNVAHNRIDFIKSLKQQNTNSRKYLIETVPEIFNQVGVNIALSDSINATKQQFDEAKNMLIKYIINSIRAVFDGTERASLTSIMADWYDNLQEGTKQYLFAGNENVILSLVATITNDETAFSERIGKAITGLKVDDWDQSVALEFRRELQNFKETVEEYNNQNHDENNADGRTYRVIFIDDEGQEIIKTFEKVDYSNRAKLLYQDVTAAIEEMGESISKQEKRQVLMEILEKMCM